MPQVSENRQLTHVFLLVLKTTVSLEQTTQIILTGISFIIVHIVYAITNKTRLNQGGTNFLPGADAPHVYMRASASYSFRSLIRYTLIWSDNVS